VQLRPEPGVCHDAPGIGAVAYCVGLKLHETRRGAVLTADLDMQTTTAVIDEDKLPLVAPGSYGPGEDWNTTDDGKKLTYVNPSGKWFLLDVCCEV
jgi:hypothetical protein